MFSESIHLIWVQSLPTRLRHTLAEALHGMAAGVVCSSTTTRRLALARLRDRFSAHVMLSAGWIDRFSGAKTRYSCPPL